MDESSSNLSEEFARLHARIVVQVNSCADEADFFFAKAKVEPLLTLRMEYGGEARKMSVTGGSLLRTLDPSLRRSVVQHLRSGESEDKPPKKSSNN